MRCITIELYESEIGVLVNRGLLEEEARGDDEAVKKALYRQFKVSLV